MKLKRYIRAFFGALWLTLRGKAIQPPQQKYPALYTWMEQGQDLIRTTLSITEQAGMDQSARKAFVLRLDHRDVSMDLILETVAHHMTLEYPMLLRAQVDHNETALYAMNMDDQYRVGQLAASALPPRITEAIEALSQHLAQIPPSI